MLRLVPCTTYGFILYCIVLLQLLQVTVAILSHKRGLFACPHPITYAYDISNMLIVVSSSTNFIIYFFLRPHFRGALRDRMMCVEPHNDYELSMPSAGAWHADSGRQNAKLTASVDRNNHIGVRPVPVALVECPLMSAPPRNRTSTM